MTIPDFVIKQEEWNGYMQYLKEVLDKIPMTSEQRRDVEKTLNELEYIFNNLNQAT